MNLFELFVKIGVDDQASSKLQTLSGKLGNGLKSAAKVGLAAMGAAATGITALTTSAIKNYAEYEQLVGGVDTLFKDASKKVQQYASEAYRTSGMSANDYMSNVTAFSASLIGSLEGDTEAAAEVANRAMTDMSNNANKMGTSIDSIVATYQSLSRGNFAMLDNLKLGYGGTKAELQRLIKDAATYTDIQKEMGVTVDASSMSFDNIINAISVVQGKLGIAGATALEASTTIEGSTNSMKAAWSNLVTGVADDNADFDGLVNNFVESVESVGENLLPRIEIAMGGVGKLVEGLAPVVTKALPTLVKKTLPPLIKSASGLLKSVGGAIIDNADMVLDSALDVGLSLVDGIIDFAPDLIGGVGKLIGKVVPAIVKKIPDITKALVGGVSSGVYELAKQFNYAILGIPDAVGELKDQISAKGDVFESFNDSVANAKVNMADMSQLLSENGQTIGQLDDKYREVEDRITSILSSAMAEQRELRKSELEDIAGYNEQLKELLDQKVGVYTSQIQSEGTKLELGFAELDYEELVASKSRLDTYLEEAIKASEDAYATDLTNLRNYYASMGLLDTRAYDSALKALSYNHEQQKSEIEGYYADALALIGAKSAELNNSVVIPDAASKFMQTQFLEFPQWLDWLGKLAYDWAGEVLGTNEVFAQAIAQIDETAVNSLLVLSTEVKKSGEKLTKNAQTDISVFLDLFQAIPPNLEDTAKESLLRMISGLEEEIPELENAADMTCSAIVDVLRRELLGGELREIGKDAGGDVKSGLDTATKDAKTWGKDLVDNYASGIKSRKTRLIDEVAGLAKGMKDYIGFSEPEKGPLSNFHTYAPDMMELFAQGIRENENIVYNQLEKSFNFGNRLGSLGDMSLSNSSSRNKSPVVINMGGVTISVGGSFDDAESLAELVSVKLQEQVERSIAVYG